MITVFEFEQTEVRFVGTANDPWWVASDVCMILDIKNVGDALSRLDEDEKRDDIAIADVIGRSQSVWCINQSGLYSLVLTSRKLQAKRFKKWVTSEVLPSIYKTGSYALPESAEMNRITRAEHPTITFAAPNLSTISEAIDLMLGQVGLDPRLVAGVKGNAFVRYYPELTIGIESAKTLLPVLIEEELVRPTVLAEKLVEMTGEKWSAIRVNKLLLEQEFQVKNPDGKNPTYLPTEKGKEHGQLVLDTARGRDKTIQSLQWKLSVLKAIELAGGEA